MSDLWVVGAISALLTLLSKIVFDWLRRGKNGPAGERSVEFWDKRFNEVLSRQREMIDKLEAMQDAKQTMHQENLRMLQILSNQIDALRHEKR